MVGLLVWEADGGKKIFQCLSSQEPQTPVFKVPVLKALPLDFYLEYCKEQYSVSFVSKENRGIPRISSILAIVPQEP